MSDFQGAIPQKILDATDPTRQLKVNADGSINTTSTATISGSVAVTATDLDIRDLTPSSDKVAIGDGTNTLAINANGSVNAVVSGSVTVSATDLDVRNLSHAQDSIKLGDGTDFLSINSDGSINVSVQPQAKTAVCAFFESTPDIGSGASTDFDHLVTSGKKFKGESLMVSSRGASKVIMGIWDGTTLTKKFTWIQQPGHALSVPLSAFELVGDGTKKVRISVTNFEGQATAAYATLQGFEE